MTEQRKGRRRGMTGFQGGQQEPGHVQPISQVRELEFYPEDNGGHGRFYAGESTPSGLCF